MDSAPEMAMDGEAKRHGLSRFRPRKAAQATEPASSSSATGGASSSSSRQLGRSSAQPPAGQRSQLPAIGKATGGSQRHRVRFSGGDDGAREQYPPSYDDHDDDRPLSSGATSDDEDEDADGDEVDEKMVADMQASTGLPYDEIVALLRDYRELRRADAADSDDAPKKKGKAQHGSRRDSNYDEDDLPSAATQNEPQPPRRPLQVVQIPEGAHPTHPKSVANPHEARDRMQQQLDDLLADIEVSNEDDRKRQSDAEAILQQHRQRAEQRKADARTVLEARRGTVETPTSLKVRDNYVERYEIETEARRQRKEAEAAAKREAEEAAARERREKGFLVNMALKQRIASGAHMSRKGAAASSSARGAVLRDLNAMNRNPEDDDEGFIAVELDATGLPVPKEDSPPTTEAQLPQRGSAKKKVPTAPPAPTSSSSASRVSAHKTAPAVPTAAKSAKRPVGAASHR